MQRGSDKHGPAKDDAMSTEVRGLTRGGHDPRAEEWRSPEPPGDDQPLAGTPRGGAPEGMTPADLDARAELASLLGKEIWPADTATVQRRVRDRSGPDRIIDLVDRLPEDRVYQGASEVWAVLTGEREDHRF
jgi:hypothetical protein